jgi:CRP/FNR family cyclic AMP-dependent transcriptional regulator
MAESVTSRIEREIFFRTFARFARPPEAVVRQFVESLTEHRMPRGAVLFRAGDPGEYIYNVLAGTIELRDPTGLAAPWTFTGRSAIGVLDSIQGQPYSRTAVVLEDALLLRLRFDDYFEILEDNFEFTKVMVAFIYRGVEEVSRPLAADIVYPPCGCDEAEARLLASSSLDLVGRVLVLRSAASFRGIRLQVLVRLAQEATERVLMTGEPLFEPGRCADNLWFVARGSVIGRREAPPLAARFGPGEVVLPLAALGQVENLYRATAAEPSVVLGLRKADLLDVMEDHSDVTRALLAHAARERARLQTIAVDLAAQRPTAAPSPSDRG